MNDPTDQNYPVLSRSQKLMRNHDGRFIFEADEFHGEAGQALSIATKAATTVYTVPAGKKLHIRTIEVEQDRAVARKYTIKNGSGVTIWGAKVLSGATSYGRTGIVGITATGAISVTRNSKATGIISIGGVLDPQDLGF